MRKYAISIVVILVALLAVVGGLAYAQEVTKQISTQASSIDNSFTYQGQLKLDGEPVTDACNFAFGLYDAISLGNQAGITQTEIINVTDGLFTVNLDFGDVFTGTARWLEIAVDCGEGSYTSLGRQELTATPYALYALGAPWSGLVGVPGDIADGDDDTTYTDGFGLDLTGNQFSVVTSTVQARVGGGCALGSTIRAINADGAVICQLDAPLNRSNPPSDNTITTLSNSGQMGEKLKATIGVDGLGLICFADTTTAGNTNLRVAHCDDLACTSATFTTLDTSGNVGSRSSIAIGTDGLGLIGYSGDDSTTLKVAHCNNTACTNAVSATIDTGIVFGLSTSIMVGADGLGIIAYSDTSSGILKVAHCHNISCTSADTTTLDNNGDIGSRGVQMAIGVDGLGLISYEENTGNDLRVAHCHDLACTSATTTTLDSAVSFLNVGSIVIGSDGLGLIMYLTDNDLKVAHCDDLACTSATLTTLDSVGKITGLPSVTIGADGLAITSYTDDTNTQQRVAHCMDVTCSNATITVLDNLPSNSTVRPNPVVVIGVDGMPLISYMDSTNRRLRVAHCSNPFCAPYFQRP
jgi:hypothetical protein